MTFKKLVLIMTPVFLAIGIFIFILTHIIYPTSSSQGTLNIVQYSKAQEEYNQLVITLEHYNEGKHIADYTLNIESGVDLQDPQSHELPQIEGGSLKVNVELSKVISWSMTPPGIFTLTYNHAEDLYQDGLLIYFTLNDPTYAYVGENLYEYEQYIYFVSGDSQICYFNGLGTEEWTVCDNPPPLKKVRRIVHPYLDSLKLWKQCEWTIEEFSDPI